MAANLVGKTLGEYRLEEIIGEGGMATVYKAYQVSLKRAVAVKVLYYPEQTSVIRFEREAKAIAALRHRNILIIYEYGEYEGLPFIAMEYVEGGTLEDRLTGQPMEWRRVLELVIPIAEALQYAHSSGVIHRDIKPSNILMPQEDWPLLADFGLVKRFDEQKGLTLAGTFLGTPSYIAPEQARDMNVDYRADMYALGVIMFEMITGRLPFDHPNPNRILLAHVKDPPPQPRELNPDCPPVVEDIILKTLQKSPDDRYADMAALVAAMRRALGATYSVAEPKVQPVAAPPTETSEPESAPVPESGFGRFFKKIFGLGQKTDAVEKESGQGSKTSPQEQVDVAADDEFDQTVRLSLGDLGGQAAVMPHLVLQGKNITIALPTKNNLIIGRTYGSSVADIDLEPYDAQKYGISRRHARLYKQDERWFLEDLNSLNGTFVNGVRLKAGQPVALKNEDRLQFSQMKFVFLLP